MISIHLVRQNCAIDLWNHNGCRRSPPNIIPKNSNKWITFSCVIDNINRINFVVIDGIKYNINGYYRLDTQRSSLKQNINICGYVKHELSNNLDECMSCDIKEIRLWNIARTFDDIKSDENKTLNGNENGLIGYWLNGAKSKNSLTKDNREMTFKYADFRIDAE